MLSLLEKNYSVSASLCVQGLVERGAELYERNKVIPRLLPLAPDSLQGAEPETTQKILRLLSKALRCERAYGRAGSYHYDLNRHLALAQAFTAERAGLTARYKKRWPDR